MERGVVKNTKYLQLNVIETHQIFNGRALSRGVVIHLYTELVATIKTTGITINCLYTIRLRNFGFAFSRAMCVIVEYVGKSSLKTVIRV